jgi:hypothetical protein
MHFLALSTKIEYYHDSEQYDLQNEILKNILKIHLLIGLDHCILSSTCVWL